MKALTDREFILRTLEELIAIPSPSGYTDQVVRYVCGKLTEMGVSFDLTRRGAIRATLQGEISAPARAIVAHIDTLGAMVKNLKPNGRLQIVPIGYWSSRFAEGARVTIYTDSGPKRGSILPTKASGHTFNHEIDELPVSWDHVEVRVDEACRTQDDLVNHGFNVGDFIAVDPGYEATDTGFINSRYLDDKAGAAALLCAARAVTQGRMKLPLECHLLFTISEEVGSGASAVLRGEVSEMLSIDNSTIAPGQNSSEYGITIAMKDSTGPFDYHLTKKAIRICEENGIPYSRDVFRWYRCDAASAVEAGNDIRTALVCFACDASHSYERTHIESLEHLSRFLTLYMRSSPTLERDKYELASTLKGFPTQQID